MPLHLIYIRKASIVKPVLQKQKEALQAAEAPEAATQAPSQAEPNLPAAAEPAGKKSTNLVHAWVLVQAGKREVHNPFRHLDLLQILAPQALSINQSITFIVLGTNRGPTDCQI